MPPRGTYSRVTAGALRVLVVVDVGLEELLSCIVDGLNANGQIRAAHLVLQHFGEVSAELVCGEAVALSSPFCSGKGLRLPVSMTAVLNPYCTMAEFGDADSVPRTVVWL